MATLDLSKVAVYGVDGKLDVAASIAAATKGLRTFYEQELTLSESVRSAVHAVFASQPAGTLMSVATLSTMVQQRLIDEDKLDISDPNSFRRSATAVAEFVKANSAEPLEADKADKPGIFYSQKGKNGGTGVLEHAKMAVRVKYPEAIEFDTLLSDATDEVDSEETDSDDDSSDESAELSA